MNDRFRLTSKTLEIFEPDESVVLYPLSKIVMVAQEHHTEFGEALGYWSILITTAAGTTEYGMKSEDQANALFLALGEQLK